MPKEIRGCSPSANRSRMSPYPCSSKHVIRSSSKKPLDAIEDIKEWEEARCPVCMEHPHNAVLLICSSHEKGCRPYMCDTSYRHSNCLDQFCKSFAEAPTIPAQEEASHSSTGHQTDTSETMQVYMQETSEARSLPGPTLSCESHMLPKLVCPLCRGQVNRWVAVEPARQFMNAKARTCASETCDYSGPYADLRKHARLAHPLVRPSEADPERQRKWRRMERERDLGDVLSTIHSAFGEERADDSAFSARGSMLGVLIFFRVSLSESGASSSWSSTPSPRHRRLVRTRRRSMTSLWRGRSPDAETGTNSREGDNSSSESVPPVSQRRLERNQRRRMPDEEQ